MAKFQIKLLTSKKDSFNNTIGFLETPISEFYRQEESFNIKKDDNVLNQRNTYCYTFNEKLSIHQNGQKEFSFSMIKNIWLDDSLVINPFIISS